MSVPDIYFRNNVMNAPSRCAYPRQGIVNLVLSFFEVKARPRLRDAVYDYHVYPSGLFSFSLRFSVPRYVLLSRINFILVDERHKKFRGKQKIDKNICAICIFISLQHVRCLYINNKIAVKV